MPGVTAAAVRPGQDMPGRTGFGPTLEIKPVSTVPTPSSFDEERLQRFKDFAESFKSVFPRNGQVLRFRAYVKGLLEPADRKNVGAIAALAAEMLPGSLHVAQALQHFVAESAWDHSRLMATYRAVMAPLLADPGACWILHDGVVEKKGRQSVGVQRQFARTEGRKLNCQVVVMISQVGPLGAFPVSGRLYLPANWLRDNEDLARRTVPEELRIPASKSEVALTLLEELRAEGWTIASLEAEDGYATVSDFTEGLAKLGIHLQEPVVSLSRARTSFDELRSLGLDHYEGRTWTGWHHHFSLVAAAFAFLVRERKPTAQD